MQLLMLALLVLVATESASSQHVRYVKPNNSSLSCPGQPCLTLDQYTSQAAKYFTAGSDFLFLAGKHSVHTTVILQNISDVIFRPKENDSDVTILCMEKFTIQCKNVTNLTIEGITFVLYGDGITPTRQSSILSIFDSKEVSLCNLRFRGTLGVQKTLVRAAHCIHSNVTILSCLFEGSTGYRGGAILASDRSSITLGATIFTKNKAVHSGGAIFANKSTLLLNETLGNTFTFNSAGLDGGALFCLNSSIITGINNATDPSLDDEEAVPNTIFESNSADSNNGGAIYCKNGNLHFTARALFACNIAGANGGAIAIHGIAAAFLGGTAIDFNNNVANDIGGGVAINSTQLVIATERINFINNSAGINGGALDIDFSSLIITSEIMNIVNNSVYDHIGGGINVFESVLIVNTTNELNLIGNYAYFQGGGIHCVFSTCIVKMANFIRNSAYTGGGFDCEGHSNCSIASANFINNTGAVAAGESTISHHDINVMGNSGSAIFVADSNVTFSGDTRISENIGEIGGGIRAVKSSVFFMGTIVFETNNAIATDGGAIFMFNTHLLLAGIVLFENNSAVENGGAISVTGTSSIILSGNVTFASNQAEIGGAMYFENGATVMVKLNTSLVTSHNYATKQGGAIYHTDSIISSQCKFTRSEDDEDDNVDIDISGLPNCFLLLEFQVLYNGSRAPWSISSNYDSAGVDGGFLYGGLLDKCQVFITYKEDSIIAFGVETLYYMMLDYKILNVKSKDTAVSKPVTSEPYVLCFCESNQEFNCSDVKSIETYRGRKFTVRILALSQGDTVSSTPLRAELSPTARLKSNQVTQGLPQNCTDMPYSLYSTEEQEVLKLYPDGGSCRDIGMARAVVNVKLLPCPDAFTLSGDHCACEERLQEYSAECTIFDDDFYITINAESKFWVSALYSNGTYQGLILSGTCPIGYCKTKSVNISILEPDIQCDQDRSGMLCGACAVNSSLVFGNSKCQVCSNTYIILLLPFAAAGIVLVIFISILRMTVATGLINSVILYANIVQANRNLLFPGSTNTNVLTVFIAWMNLDLGFQTCFYHGMDAHVQTWLQFAFPLYVWVLISLIIFTSRYSMRVTKLIGSNPIAVLATLLLMSYTKIIKIIIDVYSPVRLYYPGNETVTMWLKDANMPYLQSWHLVLAVVTTLVLIFLFLPYTLLLLLGYKLYRFPRRWYFCWLIKIKPLLESYYAPYKPHTRYWTGFLLLVRCPLYIIFSFNSVGTKTKSLLAINIAVATLTIVLLSIKVYTRAYNNVIEALVYLNLIVLSAAALSGVNSPAVVNSLVGIVFSIMVGIIVYHFHIFYFAKLWQRVLAKLTGGAGNELAKLTEDAGNEQADEATEQLHCLPKRPVVTRSVIERVN